jgi:hypothetical protein
VSDSGSDKNPFERFGLDPAEGIAGITERMREHIHAASSESEKAEIRDAWVALTRDPRRRLALSLGAHPETRSPLGAPPPPRVREELTLDASAVLPFVSLATCFGATASTPDTSASWQEDLIFVAKSSPHNKPRPVTKKKE